MIRSAQRAATLGNASRRNLTTLGIRREDPSRIWERRTPLTPADLETLLAKAATGPEQLRVQVESCGRRCFPDEKYSAAGAFIVPSLSKDVDVVLGIKEPPLADVRALVEASKADGKKRTWMMFSHTHKGQEYNLPLLSAFLHPTQTLIDHELLVTRNPPGKGDRAAFVRVAAFGWYAGVVGLGEALSLTGLALLRRGIATPLLNLPRPYTFESLADFKTALRKTGERMRSSVVKGRGPVIFGLTGGGNVSEGASDMLQELGVIWIKPSQLSKTSNTASNEIYACRIDPSSYLEKTDGSEWSREDYYKSPEKYISRFHDTIAPYITTLVNGVGWSTGFPRLLSNANLDTLLKNVEANPLLQAKGKQRLVAVQDISCDKEGGVEFVDRYTTIDNPYFEGPHGILVSSIDILPTELAVDASMTFSSKLLPYVQSVIFPKSAETDNDGEVTSTIENATIVKRGQLQPKHQWLSEKVASRESGQSPLSLSKSVPNPAEKSGVKKILLLGSGLVAGPAIDVLASRPDVLLSIASNNVSEAESHIKNRANIRTLGLDIANESDLANNVAASDVVVSLLPAAMHPLVAKHCIANGKHLITASYVTPEMKALHQSAVDKDVLILGECGLDPGIDSMAAMRILDKARKEGKKVTSFVSWCGGLPEMSASHVPLRYKFSWSPKAVLTASGNDAKFKLDGKEVSVTGQELLAKHFPNIRLWDELPLEGLANRDSIPYAQKYGLGPVENLTNLFRGTLRYSGFSSLMDSFRRLGLLRQDPLDRVPASWDEFLRLVVQRQRGRSLGDDERDVRDMIKSLLGEADELVRALEWLSLLPSAMLPPSLPHLKSPNPIDYFAHLLSHKLSYAPHERDTSLLHHAFTFSTPSGSTQKVTASLKHIATDHQSSMSITVGKTVAFAALRVADGHVQGRGVTGPYEREVWEGVLEALEEVGVVVEEEWE